MIGHTPGPWKAHTYPPEEGQQHHVTAGKQDTLRICETGRRDLRSASDAQLIAAAPDLLAALKDIAAQDPDEWQGGFMDWAQGVAEAAIAKAKP